MGVSNLTGTPPRVNQFDAQNRLVAANSSSDSAAIAYDARNRPVKRTLGAPLLPTSAVSRKAHGTVGSLDVNLPLSGTAGVECRRGGTTNDYQMVLTFPRAVTFSGASLSSGTGSVASSSTSSDGKQVTVNLTGVVSGQTIVMTLGGVRDGAVSNSVAVGMGVLIADTNADGVVNSGDASQVAAQAGQALTAANFRTDVNADGSINSGDNFLARSKAGTALPASPPVTQTPPTMYLFYDGWNLIAEFDASGNQLAKYVHGAMIDEVLTRISASGSRVYYHQDALGSTAKLTDASGGVVEQYSYAAFGMPTIKTASGATVPTSAYGNRFMFTGREYLATLKFYDYRNRVYLAELGRFLQTDPMRFDAGDVNLYRYVWNNPILFADPNGLLGIPPAFAPFLEWVTPIATRGLAGAGVGALGGSAFAGVGAGPGAIIGATAFIFFGSTTTAQAPSPHLGNDDDPFKDPFFNPDPSPDDPNRRRTCEYSCQTQEGHTETRTEAFPGEWGSTCPELQFVDPDTGCTVDCDVVSGPE